MASLPPNFQQIKTGTTHPFLHDQISVPDELQANVLITTVDKIYNWSRRSSMWPLLFGLACCAIEMIATAASRYDLARFGMEVMRPSPRQSDLMNRLRHGDEEDGARDRAHLQPDGRTPLCAEYGSLRNRRRPFKEGYKVVSGIDKYIPVDVYVPGCPPTPEALIYGLLKMHEKIDRQSITSVPWYRKDSSQFVPVPRLGPDVFDPRQVDLIKNTTLKAATAAPATSTNGAAAGAEHARGPQTLSDKAKARMGRGKETLADQERVASVNGCF